MYMATIIATLEKGNLLSNYRYVLKQCEGEERSDKILLIYINEMEYRNLEY